MSSCCQRQPMRHLAHRLRSTTCVRRCGRPSGTQLPPPVAATSLQQQPLSRRRQCRSADSRRPASYSRAASRTPTCWVFTAAARARRSLVTWRACLPDLLSNSTALRRHPSSRPTGVLHGIRKWILNLIVPVSILSAFPRICKNLSTTGGETIMKTAVMMEIIASAEKLIRIAAALCDSIALHFIMYSTCCGVVTRTVCVYTCMYFRNVVVFVLRFFCSFLSLTVG